MLHTPFIASRTLQEVLILLENSNLNIAKTERLMGITRGRLDCRIKSRKWLQFFKDKYPQKFEAATTYDKYVSSRIVPGMSFHAIPCMNPDCDKIATVKVPLGAPLPRGLRKWCETCSRVKGNIAAGCFCTGGGGDDQISTW